MAKRKIHALNVRLQTYRKNRMLGMDIYNSAIAAGYSHGTASEGYRKFKSAEQGGLREVFHRKGLTDEALADHALKGLEANKVISCNVIALDGESMKDAHSMTKDFIDVPDWMARHKYLQVICELTGRLDKTEIKQTDALHIQVLNIVNNYSKVDDQSKKTIDVTATPAAMDGDLIVA